jgi:hypothetical protein
MRHYIHLAELFQVDSGGHPPVMTDPGEGGRPGDGEYWIHGNIKVKITNDFADMVFRAPQEFGFSPDAVMNKVRGLTDAKHVEMIGKAFRLWHHNERNNSHENAYLKSSIARWSGARTVGVNVLLDSGWAYVGYKPPANLDMWVAKAHLKEAMGSLSKQFPLMETEELDVMVMDRLWEGNPATQHKIKFRKEDFPGIAGMFKAVMQWTRNGTVPQQHWYYALADNLDEIATHGLAAVGPRNLYIGNWTERGVYVINYMPSGLYFRAWKDKGTAVRFASSEKPDGVEINRDDMAHTMVLYSKKPFSISPENLQVKTGGFWHPLVQDFA